MSSTRAERATLVALLNARIAASLISLYRLPTDGVVAHSCRNRTSSAVAVGGAHGRKPASRFPGTPGGGGLGRAGMLSCHQPKGSS